MCKYIDYALIDLQSHEDSIDKLGRRHDVRGIKQAHYELVGQAFLLTLKQALGDEFTEELKQYWGEFYLMVQSMMLENSPHN